MKTIEVVASIIHQNGTILATQRGYGDFKGLWEFPGGKIEPGETPEEALCREIQEELGITISVENHICTIEYDYPNFHLTMYCYWCSIEQGELILNEHQSARWLEKSEWESVEWLPADIEVVKEIQKYQC